MGERSGELEALINGYKFERKKASYLVCASMLHSVLPELPLHTVVVPVPTIAKHIRQRGYDHTALVAKQLAQLRQLHYVPALIRVHNTVQFGATRKVRLAQAKQAFRVKQGVANVPHLLVDDVSTTGATVQYAAKQLLDAGASDVWVAVVARQPLDKRI